MKKSLRQFNADKVAKFETGMWHAYYKHNPFKLLYLLTKLAREFFGLRYISAIRIGYYAALATLDFSLNRGKENGPRIIKNITRFYQLISIHSSEHFDYEEAARLELEWWLVDRYPDRYKISREEAIARAMAVIFNMDYSRLNDYANYRAKAMMVQDEAQDNKREADWKLIQSFLERSYRSLYQAVQ